MAKADSMQGRLLAVEEGRIGDALGHWVRVNQLAIGSVAAIILLLVSGSFYWKYQKASALESLRRGILALQNGDAQKALEDLQKAENSSLSNTERTLGLFYLGEAYAALNKTDDAAKGYERALAVVNGSKPGSYLEQLLLIKLAQSAESKEADADARQKYEKAAALDGPLKSEALAAAARLAEKLTDSAAAKAHYEKLFSVSPTHPLVELFQGKSGK